MLNGADGQQATYQDLSVVAFVKEYVLVMHIVIIKVTKIKEQMSLHVYLVHLMEDTDSFDWKMVQPFHGTWFNQLEQDRCMWSDVEEKLKMKRSLMWHAAMVNRSSSVTSLAGTGMMPASNFRACNAPAKPGTKACEAFNTGHCFEWHEHPKISRQYICTFCLSSINRA